ncbi:Tn3 family transposase [Nocardia salmonicida]|uniref:Tn3 family transposase n=1 Tax=Nocardia salmonicida TaxID=53431 RepID=UPI0037B4B66C
MISRDGNPTSLGQAIAHYGRIFKTLHILRLADDEPYRREAKAQANIQEGRHDLGRTVFHGKKGEMTRAYLDGMEDQLAALGLILNCVVLWNSVYLDRALVHERRTIRCAMRMPSGCRRSCAAISGSKATTASRCPISVATTDRYAIPTPPTRTNERTWARRSSHCPAARCSSCDLGIRRTGPQSGLVIKEPC